MINCLLLLSHLSQSERMFICGSKTLGALQTGSGEVGTFSRWHERPRPWGWLPAGALPQPAPVVSAGGGKLTGLHPGWLAVPPWPDVPREANGFGKGPLCWHGRFQQTNENALLLKSSRTLWGPRGCKSTLFLFFGCAMWLWHLSSPTRMEPRPSVKAQSPNHCQGNSSMPPAPTASHFLFVLVWPKVLR